MCVFAEKIYVKMEIQRNIISDLLKWQQSKYRKPLVLQGARQVGKSFVLDYFGRNCFDKK